MALGHLLLDNIHKQSKCAVCALWHTESVIDCSTSIHFPFYTIRQRDLLLTYYYIWIFHTSLRLCEMAQTPITLFSCWDIYVLGAKHMCCYPLEQSPCPIQNQTFLGRKTFVSCAAVKTTPYFYFLDCWILVAWISLSAAEWEIQCVSQDMANFLYICTTTCA